MATLDIAVTVTTSGGPTAFVENSPAMTVDGRERGRQQRRRR
jgi:hypothetical protein